MQSDVLIKAELDKLIKDTAARAKEHHVSISFEYHGVKYTIAPIGVVLGSISESPRYNDNGEVYKRQVHDSVYWVSDERKKV